MLIVIDSPLFCASSIFLLRQSEVYLDSDNRPTAEFFPTKMQPALSAAVLPLCMRIPSKWGTFNNLGRLRPNLGDQL